MNEIDQPRVVINFDRYIELLEIEKRFNKGEKVDIIDDEDISNALMYIIQGGSPKDTIKKFNVQIVAPLHTDGIVHPFTRKLIIKKLKTTEDGK